MFSPLSRDLGRERHRTGRWPSSETMVFSSMNCAPVLVLRAEGHLRPSSSFEIEPEQLVVPLTRPCRRGNLRPGEIIRRAIAEGILVRCGDGLLSMSTAKMSPTRVRSPSTSTIFLSGRARRETRAPSPFFTGSAFRIFVRQHVLDDQLCAPSRFATPSRRGDRPFGDQSLHCWRLVDAHLDHVIEPMSLSKPPFRLRNDRSTFDDTRMMSELLVLAVPPSPGDQLADGDGAIRQRPSRYLVLFLVRR